MPSFLGVKSGGAFGQPAFFLAGNRVTIVAFQKQIYLKSLSLFSKTIVFYSIEVLNLRKNM